MPTDRSFDYMIKSRYLNIVPVDSRIVLDKNQLAQAIRYSWYIRNSQAINITQYDVILSEYGFYTSIFKEYTILSHLDFKFFFLFSILVYHFYEKRIIERIFYFVTVNGKNIEDDSKNILQPNIDDFNSVMNTFLSVSKD